MRRTALLASLLLVLAACTGSSQNTLPFGDGSSTTQGGSGSTTTGGDTTTTTQATTTTEPDFFEGDAFSVQANVTADQPSGPDALLAGAPSTTASLALTAELEAGGVDLTGTELIIWPVYGETTSILVFEFTEEAENAESSADADLLELLLASEIVQLENIDRVVFNFRAVDEEGPYVFTYTVTIDELRTAAETGGEPQNVGIQIQRVDE